MGIILNFIRWVFQKFAAATLIVGLALAALALWLFLKGPPGSGKTELVSPLKGQTEWATLVSNLTPAALISGYGDPTRDEGDQSLLPQLNGIELCRVMRNDPRWATVAVLFLTELPEPR